MTTQTRTERFRKSLFIFTIGLICGVVLFHTYLKQFGCQLNLASAGIPMTPTIFAGIIRDEHDSNETMALQRMLQYDMVYVTGLVCENQDGDVKSSVVYQGCLQQLYQHQNMYEWFVLTADVVNLHVLPTLLLSLPHHVPVSLVYPECPGLSYLPGLPHLLILNQAALHLLLRESTRSANSTICALMQDTINLPLEKVTYF